VAKSQQPEWLGQAGWFRTVEGWDAVTDLLGEPRMHADLVGVFDGLGIERGAFRDLISASLLSMNGTEHKRYRAVVAPAFTPRSMERIRPAAREEAHRRIDQFAAADECEFMREFAAPYVAGTMAPFLGIPPGEVEEFLPYVRLLNARGDDPAHRLEDNAEGMRGLAAYAKRLIRRRHEQPTDDVVSIVAEAVRGDVLPELVAVTLVAGLLSAGHDPTINQMGLMIEVLSERPDVWDAVGTGAVDPAGVIEEILRYRQTNHQVSRRVAESFEYDGVRFEEGEHVVMRLVSANHDRCHFADADGFDPEANRGAHVAFGYGPHFCLGAALARTQLQEALRALAGRLQCPTVVASRPVAEGGIVGPASLSITFEERVGPFTSEPAL
jgi:cytochrome P450